MIALCRNFPWRLCVVFAGGITFACAAKPFLFEGNANSAQVMYGGDVAAATAVAKRHCAQFERVPQFREISEDIAYFDCVRP
jgi:hypothetical protein